MTRRSAVADPSRQHRQARQRTSRSQTLQAGGARARSAAPRPDALKTWTAPTSNEAVTVTFKQSIGANDALRTGTYSKTLTFTLSTTTP